MINVSRVVLASALAFGALASTALAQSAPPVSGGGLTVAPTTSNANNAQSQASSNPVGENINQQNNFNYAGQNSFAPGITCSTPYITSSLSRFDGSQSSGTGQGNMSGSLGLVVPLGGGGSHNCAKLADEIVIQRQLDTCLNVRRAGFKFDPTTFPELAKRCNGLVFAPNEAPAVAAPPAVIPQTISPTPPPTVITVPANPAPTVLYVPSPIRHLSNFAPRIKRPSCSKLSSTRKLALLDAIRNGAKDPDFPAYLAELKAGCVSIDEVATTLAGPLANRAAR